MHKTYEELMKNNPISNLGNWKIMRKYITKIDPGLKIVFRGHIST